MAIIWKDREFMRRTVAPELSENSQTPAANCGPEAQALPSPQGTREARAEAVAPNRAVMASRSSVPSS